MSKIISIDSLYETAINISRTRFDNMFKLWKTIYYHNFSKPVIEFIMNELYPSKKMNQKVFFYSPKKKVKPFHGKGFLGADEVQKLIYENQFPKSCSDRKFIVLYQFNKSKSGFGSLTNIIAGYISLGMDMNRTVIYYPNDFYKLSTSEYCKKPGLDCLHLPISNCTFTQKEIDSDPERFNKRKMKCWDFYFSYPKSVVPIIKMTATPKSMYYLYWRFQAVSFIVRLNENMKKLVKNFTQKYLINPKERYDVSLLIRLGDKKKEMNLIKGNDFIYPLEIISTLLGRKLSVFLSSDAQSQINYFIKLNNSKFDFSYLNYSRHLNGHYMKKENNSLSNSIQSYSEMIESIKGNYIIGTLRSQFHKQILGFRLQNYPEMDLPFFEIGDTRCITVNQCNFHRKILRFK